MNRTHLSENLLLLMLLAISFLCSCTTEPDVKIGETAPLFSATAINGESVSLNDFKGKIVVIYFWRNTCCGDSLKLVESYYQENRNKKLAIIAINAGDPKEVVSSYAENNKLTFTMLADEHSSIFTQYQAFGFPTIFIIDKNGVIRKKILGNITNKQLNEIVQRQFDIQKQAEESYEKRHPRQLVQ